MTLQEFRERTALAPTPEEYNQIEDIYLATGNLDKDEFCKDYKIHHQSSIIAAIYKQNEKLKEKCDTFREGNNKMIDFLLERAQVFGDINLLQKAINMIGHAGVIKSKIALELPFWDIDKEYIKDNIE